MQPDLLELNRRVIRREAGGKTIFQPRIIAWYDDRMFNGVELPGRYKGCDRVTLYERLGVSDRLYDFNDCLETQYDDSVKVETIPLKGRDFKRVYITPVGKIEEIQRSNTSNSGMMPAKWAISTVEDLRVYAYIEEATRFSFNMDTYNKLYAKLAHLGLPAVYLPRTSIQKLLIDLAGVENTYYLLADYPDDVAAYFRALSRSQEGMIRAVADSPIEWINYGDNLHCKILTSYMFEEFILPEYEKRGDVLHKAGKFVFSHWDGDVKDYLPYAKSCSLDGIEAITPQPQGDVTIEEVKKALGEGIVLLDGVPAVLFSDVFPREQLVEATQRTLELFEGQLVLGISDEMPSDGNIERVELVAELANDFNAKHG